MKSANLLRRIAEQFAQQQPVSTDMALARKSRQSPGFGLSFSPHRLQTGGQFPLYVTLVTEQSSRIAHSHDDGFHRGGAGYGPRGKD